MNNKHQENGAMEAPADFHRTCLRFCHGPLRRLAWLRAGGSSAKTFAQQVEPVEPARSMPPK